MKKILKTAGIMAIITAGVGTLVIAVKAILDYRADKQFVEIDDDADDDDDNYFEDEELDD